MEVISAEGGDAEPIFPETRDQDAPCWSPDGKSLFFGRLPWLETGKRLVSRIEKIDLATHQASEIPGSEDMLSPASSPDGKYLAAVYTSAAKPALYGFASGKWTVLNDMGVRHPAWARDSSAVYFLSRLGSLDRYDIASRRMETLKSNPSFVTSGIPWSDASGYFGIGLDGAPLILRDAGPSQFYSLDWQPR